MNIERKKSKFLNFIFWILLILFLAIPGYFFYNNFIKDKIQNNKSPDDSTQEEETDEEDTTEENESTLITYSEETVDGESFFEKFPVLEGDQQAYVAVPQQLDTTNPPSIVIYNHGDLEVLSDSVDTEFMNKLRSYAKVFASDNYVFAASYMHNNAYSNAVSDISNLIEWIKENYTVSSSVYLIGFSRGGYTTTNYALAYTENIKGIALLAPATYYTDWDQNDVNKIMDIPIKIWHGTEDVNIGIVNSYYFIDRLAEYGKTVEIAEEEGKSHYDVDDEYIDDVLDFFKSSTLQ